MPKKKAHRKKTTSVGRSFLTPYKQQCLSEIFNENLIKAKFVINKCYIREKKRWLADIYHVFEFTAGDMADESTSPYIILNSLIKKENTLDFEYWLFEENKEAFNLLKKNLKTFANKSDWKNTIKENTNLHQGNFAEYDLIDWDGFGCLGFCYFDPNGCGKKTQNGWGELSELEEFTKNWPHIDVLLNLDLNAWKRTYGVTKKEGHRKHLPSDQLKKLNKENWWVREMPEKSPQGGYKPLMMFGTNMNNYKLNRIDFHKIQLDNLKAPCEGNYLMNKYDKYIKTKTQK